MENDIYQEFIIELYKNPRNSGRIEKADYSAKAENPTCGDRIELFIKADKGVINEAKFIGNGCAISQASASLFTQYLVGKKVSALEKINAQDVLNLIKIDLSKNPSRMKCALLPLDALRKAVK
jgi:nitrogen fixation protein NifU and related proteins